MSEESYIPLDDKLEAIAYKIIGLAIEVHKLIYKEITLEHGYRIDLLVENKLVIELKTVENFTPVHYAQVLTYLKLGKYPLGLLFNFDSKILKNNIKRFINSPSRDFEPLL